jgi:hypothetical protein
MLAYTLAFLQAITDPSALPSVTGFPSGVTWGMSPTNVIGASGGAIHAPVPGSVDAVLPPPRGLHVGAQSESGDFTTIFYFSPMSDRLSAALVTLHDGTKEGSKCLPWMAEIRASLGESVGSGQTFGAVTATWATLSTTVSFVITYHKKRTSCSVLLESSGILPHQ